MKTMAKIFNTGLFVLVGVGIFPITNSAMVDAIIINGPFQFLDNRGDY